MNPQEAIEFVKEHTGNNPIHVANAQKFAVLWIELLDATRIEGNAIAEPSSEIPAISEMWAANADYVYRFAIIRLYEGAHTHEKRIAEASEETTRKFFASVARVGVNTAHDAFLAHRRQQGDLSALHWWER